MYEQAKKDYEEAQKQSQTLETAPQFSKKLPIVEISVDAELIERISKSEKSIITTIQNYIFEKYGNYVFNLSDGKKAIVDNSDAKKLGYTANEAKQSQISNLVDLVENAVLQYETDYIEHNKFNKFAYYGVKAKFNNQIFNLAINVGRAKNNLSWHIYEINDLEKVLAKNKKDLPAELSRSGEASRVSPSKTGL